MPLLKKNYFYFSILNIPLLLLCLSFDTFKNLIRPVLLHHQVWFVMFNVTKWLVSDFVHKCGWHVKGKVIWYVTKLWISKILCNVFVCQAAVSALFWQSQSVPVLYFQKKIRNRFREYSKICNFVTYQITFLMTCQQHWY